MESQAGQPPMPGELTAFRLAEKSFKLVNPPVRERRKRRSVPWPQPTPQYSPSGQQVLNLSDPAAVVQLLACGTIRCHEVPGTTLDIALLRAPIAHAHVPKPAAHASVQAPVPSMQQGSCYDQLAHGGPDVSPPVPLQPTSPGSSPGPSTAATDTAPPLPPPLPASLPSSSPCQAGSSSPPCHQAYTLPSHPGLLVVPNALSTTQQLALAQAALVLYPEPPAHTNHERLLGPLTGIWAAAQQRLVLRQAAPGSHHPSEPTGMGPYGSELASAAPDSTGETNGAACQRTAKAGGASSDQSPIGTPGGAAETGCKGDAQGAGTAAVGNGAGGTAVQHDQQQTAAVKDNADQAAAGLCGDQGGVRQSDCRYNACEGSCGARADAPTQAQPTNSSSINGYVDYNSLSDDIHQDHAITRAKHIHNGSHHGAAGNGTDVHERGVGRHVGGSSGSGGDLIRSFEQCWGPQEAARAKEERGRGGVAGSGAEGRAMEATTVLRRLRHAVLGPLFDWTRRCYDLSVPHRGLPVGLRDLAVHWGSVACGLHHGLVLEAQGQGQGQGRAGPVAPYVPDAALVHFYYSGDTLMGHRDDVEQDLEQPIVSVSLGCDAVFLMGGETKDQAPTPILLRSGDVLVLAGKARGSYHGVPRVFTDCLPPALDEYGTDPVWRPFVEHLRKCRINISVRAVC